MGLTQNFRKSLPNRRYPNEKARESAPRGLHRCKPLATTALTKRAIEDAAGSSESDTGVYKYFE
jgi:hypothetical protein